ncbi:Cytochrome P450 [Mycena kentingensis (nom. inval.)]|nr:Cytochrome P450 [Mycena kentingensis (nom. inval.)]
MTGVRSPPDAEESFHQRTFRLAFYSTFALLFALYLKKASAAWRVSPSGLPYPPGPRPLPLVGNAFAIPQSYAWLKYQEWGRQYGAHARVVPSSNLTAFGNEIVVINSAKVADDLLEKRSALYSSRPSNPIIALMGWGLDFALMEHGPEWRKHRRLMHQFFKKDSAILFRPIHTVKVHDMLRQILQSPQDFMNHVRTLTAALILKTTYGYDVAPVNDELVDLAEDSIARPGEIMFSLGFMIPWLRFLPGNSFVKYISETRAVIAKVHEIPYEYAKRNFMQGSESIASSMVARVLENGRSRNDAVDEEMLKGLTALLYSAAAETSSGALGTFFLAMTLYPERQKAAQEQIDAVVGPTRLPDISDRDQLPFVEAVLREVLRWKPPVPLSLPHCTTDNDIYEGYFIAKGTTIFPNIWAMCYDETVFPQPEVFDPTRYLTADGQITDDPRLNVAAFGHGRRICPGRYFAEDAVWLAIVSVDRLEN